MDFDSLQDDSQKVPNQEAKKPVGKPLSFDELQDDEQKYGGTSGALKAFALGAGRSASFGTLDQLLTKTGLAKSETLKGLEETNPVATGAGEVTGILGGVLAPEVGILGAASAPVKAVSRLGGAVTKGAEALLPVATSTAGKIVTQAGTHALGSAVEGAAYGLGQVVSEDALGDADLNGEKVLAHIGTSALEAGALGSIFGAIKGGIQSIFPKVISEIDQQAIKSGDFKAMAEASDMPQGQKESFIDGLTKLKSNAEEIKQAAKSIDAPILPGMISDSEAVRKGQSALLEGPPSFPALKAQQMAQQGFDKAGEAVEGTLGSESEITKASLGDTLKDIVSKSVEQQVQPINALYDEIKTHYQAIPLNPTSLKQISRNVMKLEDVPLSPQARAIAKSVAERIESLKTVDDIKRLKSIVNQELGPVATPIQKRITAIIADKLSNLEENSIVRFAEREMRTSKAKDKIMALLEQREAANAQYSVFKDKLDRLGEVMGRKKVYGAQDFLDFVDGLTPEKIADKLSGKNNSEFLGWFSKEFPEGMRSISQFQKELIRTSAMKDGEFSVRRALTQIDKMPKEYQGKIFNAEELSKLGSVKTYIQAFPKNWNPSNTANASAFRHFFEGPIAAATGNLRDYAIEKFINTATLSGDQTKEFIEGLTKVEKKTNSISRSIINGVDGIFSKESYENPTKFYSALGYQDREENHKNFRPKLLDLTANPEKLIDHLSDHTEGLTQVAPKISASFQGATSRATQFLKSKLPGNDIQKKPLSPEYKPSNSELSKWHNYFNAVEKPTDALYAVKSGTLTKEVMETLQVVYPKLLQEMRVAVSDKMSSAVAKKQVIPYRTKLSLSLFLDSDLVNSLNPISMLANQNTLTTATQNKAAEQSSQMAATSKKGLDKIKTSNRFLTPMQKSNEREQV